MRSIWSLGAVLAVSTVMMAQSPPVKMGLWETNTVIDNGGSAPTKVKVTVCITAADWEKILQGETQQRPGCTHSTMKTATGFSFDVSCSSSRMTMQAHGASRILDSEHAQSETRMTMNLDGKTNNVVSHSDSHYVSASCGAVKPGEPKIE